jgi:hypothetical protein
MAGDFENDGLGGEVLAHNASDTALIADAGDHSPGKHLVLFVPDFSNTAEAGPHTTLHGNAPMNSYLRLGMAHTAAGDATQVALGEDLAALVQGFTDDFRNRGSGAGAAMAPDLAADAQTSGGAPYAPPPNITATNDFRKAESKQLHHKGGWRDHSDGNRISTTRGDKVEVIRGNYKLVVLGRTDDTGNAVGFDMSGGQVDGSDLSRPTAADVAAGAVTGLNMTWQWRQDSDGNFRWHMLTLQGNADPSGPGTIAGVAGTSTAPSMETDVFAFDLTYKTVANTLLTDVTTTGDNVTNTTSTSGKISFTGTSSGDNDTTSVSQHGAINVTSTSFKDNTTTITATGNVNTSQTGAGINTTLFALAGGTVQTDITAGQVTNTTFALNQTNASALVVASESFSYASINLTASLNILNLNAMIAGVMLTELAAIINLTNWNGIVIDYHRALHLDNHSGVHVDIHSGMHVDGHVGGHVDSSNADIKNVLGVLACMATTGVHVDDAQVLHTAGNMSFL